jgi:hypothetical protein
MHLTLLLGFILIFILLWISGVLHVYILSENKTLKTILTELLNDKKCLRDYTIGIFLLCVFSLGSLSIVSVL